MLKEAIYRNCDTICSNYSDCWLDEQKNACSEQHEIHKPSSNGLTIIKAFTLVVCRSVTNCFSDSLLLIVEMHTAGNVSSSEHYHLPWTLIANKLRREKCQMSFDSMASLSVCKRYSFVSSYSIFCVQWSPGGYAEILHRLVSISGSLWAVQRCVTCCGRRQSTSHNEITNDERNRRGIEHRWTHGLNRTRAPCKKQ